MIQLVFLQWFLIGINLIGAIARLSYLVRGKYPRISETTIGDDAVLMTISLLMVIWTATTLGAK